MLKKISIDVLANEKDAYMSQCKNRGVYMKETFMALFEEWLNLPDGEAVDIVLNFKKKQMMRLIDKNNSGTHIVGNNHKGNTLNVILETNREKSK